MKDSLQELEDKYVRRVLRGRKLRAALNKDKQYMRALRKRKEKLQATLKVRKSDKKKYALSTDIDLEILGKIYKLEQKKLSVIDKNLVRLVRTQLEHDWRNSLIRELNRLLKKYR